MNPFRFTVSLRFFSKNVDPQEICDQLRMKPKWMHKIGDQRVSGKGLPIAGHYDLSYCTFTLDRQDEEELGEVIDRYSNELLQHRELFKKIREGGGRVEFFVGWFAPVNSGETFDSGLLRKLGELNIDLALDVYGGD